ncbi:hypothetical protein [Actinomadura chibensis]|uniref:Uncharacterized protein n=1 Tax=Actinomadura chibensis TaxID=392828 RepID=A0A5D0NX66_9ACTN|nr:hypothetical protein [Actinomadura chibensis]TYB48754.1 hypothetical protein FXF69_06165 [Actinomadura chibensis]
MRTRRGKNDDQGSPLARLRVSEAGPDPRFRAVLRERLVAAASGRGEDFHNHGRREVARETVD